MRFAISLAIVLAVCSLAVGQELLTNGGWESSDLGANSGAWIASWSSTSNDNIGAWWRSYGDMWVVQTGAGALYPAPPEGSQMIADEVNHSQTSLVQLVENIGGASKFDLSGWYGGYNDANLQIGLVWSDTALPTMGPDLDVSFQTSFDGGAVALDVQGVDTEAETGMMVSFGEQVDIGYAPAYVGLRIMYGTWTDGPSYWYALDGMSLQALGTGSTHGAILQRAPTITNAYAASSGGFSDVYGQVWNTKDPLRSQLACPPVQRGDFGNAVETNAGFSEVAGNTEALNGLKNHGQWSRLGQLIDPSLGYFVGELDPAGSHTWRTRDLSVETLATFQFDSSEPLKTQDTFTVELQYAWRGIGLAKEDATAMVVNMLPDLINLTRHGLFVGGDIMAAEDAALGICYSVVHEKFDLYGVGIDVVPDHSSFTGWTVATLSVEKADGTVLGVLEPAWGGYQGQEFTGSSFSTVGTITTSQSLTLPVGEPVDLRLTTTTHSAALGASESYFGIIGHEIKIQGPEGTDPLIISGRDPVDDPSLAGWVGSCLLQAVRTDPLIVGQVETRTTFGPVTPLDLPEVVVLHSSPTDSVSAVFVPLDLPSEAMLLTAHLDAFWASSDALDNIICDVLLMELDNEGEAVVAGGDLLSLFEGALQVDPVDTFSWHTGEILLTLDVSELSQGSYALGIVYGNPDGVSAESRLVLSGFSASAVPGDANGDGKVDLTDLGILATNWGRMDVIGPESGDFDYSGGVDLSDLGILATDWGAGVAPVPEPATTTMLALGGLALIGRRRK